ncbi:uncharacterized protein F5Z01DRAFT_672708 [Emericellopsis atlantica]|uniref:Uncharacterized protein n=1 Tax=Emericellopsis atlantica TaxID=2614577 RepID=A0A9P8CST0_9HYPO|nr:uncharacterized protein F5Z01DRAFT_672708 [Emericellopsis atlantica]KAG9256066.1 hypothetical protein F5Z01DRAFT_672708 [Emericellopsis atlantica]
MCVPDVRLCRACGDKRPYWWTKCLAYRRTERKACTEGYPTPFPPTRCPVYLHKPQIGKQWPYMYPSFQCPNTKCPDRVNAPMILAKLERARLDKKRRDEELKQVEELRKEEFARKYFKKKVVLTYPERVRRIEALEQQKRAGEEARETEQKRIYDEWLAEKQREVQYHDEMRNIEEGRVGKEDNPELQFTVYDDDDHAWTDSAIASEDEDYLIDDQQSPVISATSLVDMKRGVYSLAELQKTGRMD